MAGIPPIKAPAMSMGQMILNSPTVLAIPKVTVIIDSVLVRHKTQRRSPQAKRKAKMIVATIPGAEMGRITRKKTPNLEQPSTKAA